MKQNHVTFPCGDILLEGVWHFSDATSPSPAVIVCHPHPLYGGNMSNNVVVAICQALVQQAITAFRFNFRGAGKSEGVFGEGITEQEDVKAALALVLSTPDIDPERIGLAGYSFGTGVTVPVAVQNNQVKLLALVSPPLSDSAWEQLREYSRPKLLLSGQHDSVIPAAQLQQHIKNIPTPKKWEIIPGADHFWQGHEDELARKVAQFFATGFREV